MVLEVIFEVLYSPFSSLEIVDTFLFFSGNYGGALGANALGKGLEGNKSLRVSLHLLPLIISVIHC